MLRIDQVKHSIINASRLDANPGDCIALSAPSGAGKSVFLKILADLIPNEAQLSLNNQSHQHFSGAQWRKNVIYVAADATWWHEQVCDHFPEPDCPPTELFNAIGLDRDLWNQSVSKLSSGQRQRLALLRAIVRAPAVLLLDEPTANLDQENTLRVEALIQTCLNNNGIVIFSSHNDAQRNRLANRHWQIKDKQVIEVDS